MRRLDPWGPVLAAAAAVVFGLQGLGGVLSRDLALYAYAGQQLADGVPPYVGVLNRAGPLAHMVPGLGTLLARVLGTDDLLTMRALMLVLSVVAVWLVYLVGRDVYGSRLAGAAAAATLLASRAVVLYAGGGPREKTTMVLLVVCALLAVAHRRWGWAGVATALATLTWQPAFWLCLGAALVAAAQPGWREHRGATLRAWARFGLGGILATAVVVAYFASAGALGAFFEGFLFVNATSTHQVGLITFLVRLPGAMLGAWGWSLWLLLAGLLATVVLAWRARGATDAAGRAVVGFGAATVASLAWSLLVFNGWADAMFAAPLAAVGMGGVVAAAARVLPTRRASALGVAYALVVTLAAGVTAHVDSPDDLGPMRAEVTAMLRLAGPNATVQSFGAPQPLVLAGLRNPTRHQMFLAGLATYVDETEPGGLAGLGSDRERRRPTFVTTDGISRYPWLEPALRRDYRWVGRTGGLTWYADRGLGRQRIAALQRVAAGAA